MSDGRGSASTITAPASRAEAVDAAAAPAAVAASRRRQSRLRGALVWLLVVLCSLAVAVTAVTWWAHNTVMNTGGYMKVVGPVGKDPQAIHDLSQYISDQIVSASGLKNSIAGALPGGNIVSGAATGAVQNVITKGAEQILSTPEAYQLWLETNRVGHEQLVGLLRGQSNAVYAKGSDVTLNTLPLISAVLGWVDQKLPGALGSSVPAIPATMSAQEGIAKVSAWSGEQLPSDFGQITLVTSDALGTAQTAVKWFDRLVWIFPLVTAALIAVTILVARRRVRTAIALAVGAVIAILVARLLMMFASSYLTQQIKAGSGQGLLKQIVQAALGPLTTITVVICVIGVLVAVAVWLLGRRSEGRAGGRATG
jgi:hypothetical protein